MRKGITLLIALLLSIVALQPALAAAPAQTYFDFTLNKREVAKNELVVARYQLTKPAKRVFITATDIGSNPLSFNIPQTSTVNARGTAGVITFTVPASAGTLSPLRMMLNIDGQLRGLNLLYLKCDLPWFFTPTPEGGCLFEPPIETPAAIQRFERGVMIWLAQSKSIYMLQVPEGFVQRFDDAFVEGMLEKDASIAVPAGKLQPVRGFGLVWRSNPWVMNLLGWATEPEQGYTACVGTALDGIHNTRTYLTTPENRVIEIATSYGPYAWRTATVETMKPCK